MDDADFNPPNLPLTSLGLGLATFMRVLDTTIANVSLPTIAGNLGMSNSQSSWIITSFTVTMAISLPLTGFLSRRFGERRLFVWGTALFALTSMMCGLSSSKGMLLTFRALQGAVAGPMYPVTQSLMIATYPKAKRGLALALLGMITVVAPIAGPILGGWITDNYSWQWIFYINVPIGIFASIVVATQLAGMRQKTERPRMDYMGLFTLIVGVGALQVMLDTGNDADWFHSTQIVILSIIAVISLAVFVIWELTDDNPIVELKLFRHRNFAAGTVLLVLAYGAFFSTGLILPLWMQRVIGYNATWSGFAQATGAVCPILLTFFVGKYGPRMDLRKLAGFAFVIIGITCMLYGGFNTHVSFRNIALVRMLQGLGVAFFFMPVLTILLSDLKGHEIASGSGLSTFLRQLGGSFAASITTFLWHRGAVSHHARLTEHISAYNPIARQAIDNRGGADTTQTLAAINNTITMQSLQMSFNDLMHILGWMFLLLIPVLFFTRRPTTGGG